MWIEQDNHSTDLIKNALKEAVISNKLNTRYIDPILNDWNKNGIKTVEEANNHSQQFRSYQRSPLPVTTTSPKNEKAPLIYNWLKD